MVPFDGNLTTMKTFTKGDYKYRVRPPHLVNVGTNDPTTIGEVAALTALQSSLSLDTVKGLAPYRYNDIIIAYTNYILTNTYSTSTLLRGLVYSTFVVTNVNNTLSCNAHLIFELVP